MSIALSTALMLWIKFRNLLDGVIDWSNTGGITDASVALHNGSLNLFIYIFNFY